MIVWEIDDDRMLRFVVTVAIIDAALTLVVPLLHRISRTDADDGARIQTLLEERSLDALDQEIAKLKKRIEKLEAVRSEIAGGEAE
jgi:hypothetical protein